MNQKIEQKKTDRKRKDKSQHTCQSIRLITIYVSYYIFFYEPKFVSYLFEFDERQRRNFQSDVIRVE